MHAHNAAPESRSESGFHTKVPLGAIPSDKGVLGAAGGDRLITTAGPARTVARIRFEGARAVLSDHARLQADEFYRDVMRRLG
jgi:endonuclease/exonuclease/phosphatase family metal-dependent hydrolase